MTDDARFVGLALGGNEQGYRGLLEHHREPIYRLVRNLVRDEENAKDITQQAFIAGFAALKRFDPAQSFRNWMSRIAINKCRDWARRRAVRQFLWSGDAEGAMLLAADDDPGPERTTMARRELTEVMRAIDALPHRLKEVIMLRSVEQLSQQECAEILNITQKAVETRLYRARARLNADLAIPAAERLSAADTNA